MSASGDKVLPLARMASTAKAESGNPGMYPL